MKTKSVGIIHPAIFGPGGAGNVVLSSAEMLQKAGMDVTIYLSDADLGFCRLQTSAPIRRTRQSLPKWIKSKGIETLAFAWKFADEIAAKDVIISHNFPAVLWAARAVRASKSRPLMIWYCHEPRRDLYPDKTDSHIMRVDQCSPSELRKENENFYALRDHLAEVSATSRNDRNRAWEKKSLEAFDLILCNSQFTESVVKSIYSVPTAISYPPVMKASEISPKRTGRQRIGILASFIDRKNLANMLRGFAGAQQKKKDLIAVVGCSNPQELADWLNHHLPEFPRHAFEIADTRSEKDLQKFYQSIDLQLSLPVDEPLGLLPLEAARFQIPSLLSNHAGPAEVAQLGFGRTANPFDHQQIADKIVEWCEQGWPEIESEKLPDLVEKYFYDRRLLDDIEKAMSNFGGSGRN